MLVDMKFLEFKNIDLPIENEKMIILKLHSNQECDFPKYPPNYRNIILTQEQNVTFFTCYNFYCIFSNGTHFLVPGEKMTIIVMSIHF